MTILTGFCFAGRGFFLCHFDMTGANCDVSWRTTSPMKWPAHGNAESNARRCYVSGQLTRVWLVFLNALDAVVMRVTSLQMAFGTHTHKGKHACTLFRREKLPRVVLTIFESNFVSTAPNKALSSQCGIRFELRCAPWRLHLDCGC